MGRKFVRKMPVTTVFFIYKLSLSTPQVVIEGKFHFNHYLTKPTIWGAVRAQKPLSLQSTGINKILLAACSSGAI